MNGGNVEIKSLETLEEMKLVVDLQRDIWGYGKPDTAFPYPDRCLFEFAESGGLVGGAFIDDKIIGFSAAWLGKDKNLNKQYLHSELVGILEDYRSFGVGEKLKIHQREYAQSIDIDLIKWTFDPLKTRNANLNIKKLRAIVRTYTPDYYGNLQSAFNKGLATDRFWVEWYVNSGRVTNKQIQSSLAPENIESFLINRINDENGLPKIDSYDLDKNQEILLIEIPSNFDEILDKDIQVAKDWQSSFRNIFQSYFHNGYILTDFFVQKFGDKTKNYYQISKSTKLD